MENLHSMSVNDLSEAIRTMNLSPTELVSQLLDRSERFNNRLQVWQTLDKDIPLMQAAIREKEMAKGNYIGPLDGIPIGIKDIYFTKDIKTTCGSPIFEHFTPSYDAVAVETLKRNGSVIMGKTVTTQFACGDPPLTKNPWNLGRTPGGSSSGSAAGVAAGFFPIAFGSQTAGSVLRPAAYNGVVGFKPTHGLLETKGMYPLAKSLDTVGWFSKTVLDSALVLEHLSRMGGLSKSNRTLEANEYAKNLPPKTPPNIGLLSDYFLENAAPSTRNNMQKLVGVLSDAGANITPITLPEINIEEVISNHRIIMDVEAAQTHEDNFAAYPEKYAPKVKGIIEAGIQTSQKSYLEALKFQKQYSEKLSEQLIDCEIMLTPTALSGAPTPETTGQPVFQAPWTTAGVPAISIPYALDEDGMPLGAQLISNKFNEVKLLKTASWCENVIDFSNAPNLAR